MRLTDRARAVFPEPVEGAVFREPVEGRDLFPEPVEAPVVPAPVERLDGQHPPRIGQHRGQQRPARLVEPVG